MEVKQEWKDQSHVITLKWGEGRVMRLHLAKEQMFLTSRECPPDVAGVVRKAYHTAQDRGDYPAFVKRVLDAATCSTELAQFLRQVEHGH
jgi:hypothetical protein